jgi:hypothetical protein
MKVVVDLLWGGLLVAACSLFLAAIIYHKSDYASIGIICAGIAVMIQMSEQYHKRRQDDYQNRLKGWRD